MFDDVVVVVQLQRLSIHRLVERPGIGGVFLGEHLLQDGVAVFHLLPELSWLPGCRDHDAASHLDAGRIFHRLAAGLGRTGGGFPTGRGELRWLCVLGGRGVGTAGRDGRRGGSGRVGFPLYAFLLLETQTHLQLRGGAEKQTNTAEGS